MNLPRMKSSCYFCGGGTRNEEDIKVWNQLIFQVPAKGGRYYIITKLAVYTTYIPLIYCLLGGYIIPTTLREHEKSIHGMIKLLTLDGQEEFVTKTLSI